MIAKSKGIDFEKPLMLGYSGLTDKLLQKYIKDSAEIWEGYIDEIPTCTIGCAIGSHAGPGAIGIAFFEK